MYNYKSRLCSRVNARMRIPHLKLRALTFEENLCELISWPAWPWSWCDGSESPWWASGSRDTCRWAPPPRHPPPLVSLHTRKAIPTVGFYMKLILSISNEYWIIFMPANNLSPFSSIPYQILLLEWSRNGFFVLSRMMKLDKIKF